MGGLAVLLTVLTILDHFPNSASTGASGRPARAQRDSGALGSGAAQSSSLAWQNIRTLSQLGENAPLVTRRYQSLAVPYAEMMAGVAALHGTEETPVEAAKRAIGDSISPEVRIKALLVAEGAVSRRNSTLISVNLNLESSDSRAMQQAVLALGAPQSGMVWREMSLAVDNEQRLIQVSGVLSVLAVRLAE